MAPNLTLIISCSAFSFAGSGGFTCKLRNIQCQGGTIWSLENSQSVPIQHLVQRALIFLVVETVYFSLFLLFWMVKESRDVLFQPTGFPSLNFCSRKIVMIYMPLPGLWLIRVCWKWMHVWYAWISQVEQFIQLSLERPWNIHYVLLLLHLIYNIYH